MSYVKFTLLATVLIFSACKFELAESQKPESTEERVIIVLVSETNEENPKEEEKEMVLAEANAESESDVDVPFPAFGTGGDGLNMKVPVPPGYDWEVTQSWASHCEECSDTYSDWDYCSLSHTGNCCRYGIDFNLPGYSDRGKAVLASGDGVVKELGYNSGWGNFVLLDHGAGVCSRYAHLEPDSNENLSEDQEVCQGLKIGEIGNSGASEGPHLHFQFEDCDTGEGLARGFDDINAVPICTRGLDRYNEEGSYSFLHLNNPMRLQCGASDPSFSGAELPLGGWHSAACGHLPDCPLVSDCGRSFNHHFSDEESIEASILPAANYLWRECALNGHNGALNQAQWLTRAEALKVPLFLFGFMEECGLSVNFEDVSQESWYYPVVACGIQHGIVSSASSLFYPNREVTLAEAAKFVVEAAVRSELINLQRPSRGHFPNFTMDHWAFPYIESIYAYGGLQGNPNSLSPDQQVERGDFVLMVASLSPCYCANVSCSGGCSCDQENFACGGGLDLPGNGGGEEEVPVHEDEALVEELEVAYLLQISGEGGWAEILTSQDENRHFNLGSDALELSGPEEDLPIVVLIQAGPGNLYIDQFEPDHRGFALWSPYEGELILNPAVDPWLVTTSFESHIDNVRVLIKLPGD
jgi:murein DD-endopeptidase MepM/ murein hydrolase activator NlpD